MNDDRIIIACVLRACRDALAVGTDEARGSISMVRLRSDADAGLRKTRPYGVSDGHTEAVVAALMRDGRIEGRVEGDRVVLTRVRMGARKANVTTESPQESWGWEK